MECVRSPRRRVLLRLTGERVAQRMCGARPENRAVAAPRKALDDEYEPLAGLGVHSPVLDCTDPDRDWSASRGSSGAGGARASRCPRRVSAAESGTGAKRPPAHRRAFPPLSAVRDHGALAPLLDARLQPFEKCGEGIHVACLDAGQQVGGAKGIGRRLHGAGSVLQGLAQSLGVGVSVGQSGAQVAQ